MRTSSSQPQEDPQARSAGDETDFAPLNESAGISSSKSETQRAASSLKDDLKRAEETAKTGDEASAIELYLSTAAGAETAHEWYIEAVCCERVAEFLVKPPPPRDLERAMRLFRRAALAYDRCGLFHEAREASYRAMITRRRFAHELSIPTRHRVELWLYDVTSGFGHRPLRVIRTALLVMLSYGVLFWLIGGARHSETNQPAGLIDSIYFSGTTFTTVGFGDFLPAPHARWLAMSEGVFGAFLVGFFVVVLWRRLSQG